MNVDSTFACRCIDCPGAGCQCGCQTDASTSRAPAAGSPCACGPRCGCDAAEQGCLCTPARS